MQSKWTWTVANELKNLHLNQLESYLTLLHCLIQPTSQHPNPFHLINPNHNISHSASQPGYHLIHKLILEKILNRLENYFNFGENILHFWIWIILISSSLKSKHISQQQGNACEFVEKYVSIQNLKISWEKVKLESNHSHLLGNYTYSCRSGIH